MDDGLSQIGGWGVGGFICAQVCKIFFFFLIYFFYLHCLQRRRNFEGDISTSLSPPHPPHKSPVLKWCQIEPVQSRRSLNCCRIICRLRRSGGIVSCRAAGGKHSPCNCETLEVAPRLLQRICPSPLLSPPLPFSLPLSVSLPLNHFIYNPE